MVPWACAHDTPSWVVAGGADVPIAEVVPDASGARASARAFPVGVMPSRCRLPRAATTEELAEREQVLNRYPVTRNVLSELRSRGWLQAVEPTMPPSLGGLRFLIEAAETLGDLSIFFTPTYNFDTFIFFDQLGRGAMSDGHAMRAALEGISCAPPCLFNRVIFLRHLSSVDTAHPVELEILKEGLLAPVCPLSRGGGFDASLPFESLRMLQMSAGDVEPTETTPPVAMVRSTLERRPRDEATLPLLLYLGTMDCEGAREVAAKMRVEMPTDESDPTDCPNYRLSEFPLEPPETADIRPVAQFTRHSAPLVIPTASATVSGSPPYVWQPPEPVTQYGATSPRRRRSRPRAPHGLSVAPAPSPTTSASSAISATLPFLTPPASARATAPATSGVGSSRRTGIVLPTKR